jgi:uncharacterized protein involved in exopolysaccharide biosynthesis
MQRTKLLSDLVEIDARIIATTAQAARSSDREFERLIADVRELRKKRAEIQAVLNALSDPPPT